MGTRRNADLLYKDTPASTERSNLFDEITKQDNNKNSINSLKENMDTVGLQCFLSIDQLLLFL